MLEKVREIITAGVEPYIRIIEHETEGDDLSTIDIAAALLKMQMEQGSEDAPEKLKEMDFADTGAEAGMVRFFLGVRAGCTMLHQRISSGRLPARRDPGKAMVRLRILDSYSFVEVPREHATEVYTIMKEPGRFVTGQTGSNGSRKTGVTVKVFFLF